MHFSGARNSQWDGIYEPFEPEMDYSEIGIKLRDDDIPVLHEKLAAVGDEEYARKQVPCPLQGCLESSCKVAVLTHFKQSTIACSPQSVQ
eukprot:scaffold204875_cov21-Tisochrysis_lutea.AAC.1